MGVIQNQALIIDGSTLILRGAHDSVKREYDRLVADRRACGVPVNNLGFYTPYKLGFSDNEVSSMVSYAIDYQTCGYFRAIATMCKNNDRVAMYNYLGFVRSQGY